MGIMFKSPAFLQDRTAAATHVLLVGCGEYPHLSKVGYGGLKPLASPRLSVQAMADWFMSGIDAMPEGQGLPAERAFFNPEAPLGSLVMLASPAHDYLCPSGVAGTCTPPTIANIRQAYIDWIERLGQNENSRGIFLFCGHGVSNGTSQFLVADDFGADPKDLWSSVFHVSNTCQATIRQTSANLFFLIDACMEFSQELINQIDYPRALIPGDKSGEAKTTEWLVLRSSTTNRLAYAPQQAVSHFTAALLQALQGYCGTQLPGQQLFTVGMNDLKEAAADLMAMSQPKDIKQRQKLSLPEGDGAGKVSMHCQTRRPSVLVEMDVDPAGYRPVACAFMEDAAKTRDKKPLAAGPARFLKEQGEWTYGANANGNEFAEQRFERQFLKSATHTCRFRIP